MRRQLEPDEIVRLVKGLGVEKPKRVIFDEGRYIDVDGRDSVDCCQLTAPHDSPAPTEQKRPSKVSLQSTPEEDWLRDHVKSSGDQHHKIAKDIGISKGCFQKRMAGKTRARGRTLWLIRKYKERKNSEAKAT